VKPPAAKAAEGAPAPTTPAPAPIAAPPLLKTVLAADGLARKLGVDPATGLLPDNGFWQHILLLKALESGGTTEKSGNILGSRIRHSGGSVGTYGLFTIDGELECAGNVYAYGGSIPAKNFQDRLRNYNPDPATQFIFHRGYCSALTKH